MTGGHGVRRFHRWVSVAFTLTVIANFAARTGVGEPPAWLTYAPLLPLALLLLTGLYLLAQPYWQAGSKPGRGQARKATPA